MSKEVCDCSMIIKDATWALDGCSGIVDTWLGDQIRGMRDRLLKAEALLAGLAQTEHFVDNVVGPYEYDPLAYLFEYRHRMSGVKEFLDEGKDKK